MQSEEAFMRALVLAAGAVVFLTAIPASASVQTIGGSYAQSCYFSAENGSTTSTDLDYCNRAFAEGLSPEDLLATYVNRGIVRMLRNDFAAAGADFQAAIGLNPQHSEPWLNMAVLHFKQGDSAGAVVMFDKAITLGTTRPEIAYFGRGLAHEDTGNVRAAYFDLQKAAALKPKWSEPAKELARYQVRRP
jgi:Flp pilus assembly protein TadD